MKLSNSRLETLTDCPRFFYLAYIMGLPTLPSPPAIIGSACHECCEESLRHCQEEKIDGDILYTEAKAREIAAELPAEQAFEVINNMEDWADRFRFDPNSVVGIEVELAVDWDGNPIDMTGKDISEVEGFRGKLDLVLATKLPSGGLKLTIIDWKFGWVPPKSEKTLSADHQLMRYCWLALQEWPHVEEIELRLEFIVLDRTYKFTPDMELLRTETWSNILKLKDKLEQRVGYGDWEKHFKPRISKHCGYCSFDCPVKGTPAELKIPEDHGGAVTVAEEIVAYESAIASRMQALQFYLETTEPRLEAADRFWSVESTESNTWDWERVKLAAKNRGIDVSPLLRPPTDSQLDKHLAKRSSSILKTEAVALGAGPSVKYGDPIFAGRKRKPKGWKLAEERALEEAEDEALD